MGDHVVMKLKADFEELKATVAIQKSDISALKSEDDELMLQNAKDLEQVKATVDELKCQNAELVKKISFLRNPPFYHLCVYQDKTSAISSDITFDKELYMECNLCDEADFNLNSGVYTNGWPGTYLVSWNSWVEASHGHGDTNIHLRKNGQIINEAIQHASFHNDNGWMHEQGGRTMLIRMETGDTLTLYCDDCSDDVLDISLCISLSTFDVL